MPRLVWAAVLFVFRQRLDEVIESKPETPTVMIKRDRKYQRHDKQQNQHTVVLGAYYQQHEETENKDHQFGNDDVGQDRPDEETIFTFVEREADGTMMPDMKRALDD